MSAFHDPDNPAALPRIPGYRISRVIGYGGMSTVYLGTQPALAREVALKVMRADVLADETSRRRFENEARTLARLEHPHIVGIHEVGRTGDGLPWYSMPYLGRGHLGQRDVSQYPARIREILESLLSALAFAHARGVIHRDVKAENVLFDESGRALLADFGIALRRGHGTRVTLSGMALGSTAYMAPEQARGGQVDPRADLYSVGVLAWEMLTGSLPYQADDAVAMALAHVQSPLPELPPGLRHWQRFLQRALAKQPRQRFHNAEQMLTALRAIPANNARPSRWRGWLDACLDPLRRHRAMVWSGLGAAAAAGAVSLLLAYSQGSSTIPASRLPSRLEAVPPEPVTELPPAQDDETDTAPAAPAARRLRTAPTSLANQRLEQLRPLLAQPALSPPHIRQAVDLLLSIHKADAEHLQLPVVRDQLLHALTRQVAAAIEDGDDVRAQALLRQLPRIRAALSPPPEMLDALHAAIHRAISTRLDNTRDAVVAQRNLDTARLAGLPPAQLTALRARLRALQAPPGWTTLRLGETIVHIDQAPISRAAYARFAEASARPAAACRERASVLRVLAPRDWVRPGFAQTGADPVVCVSWQDAADYAAWASQRDGRHYRLLTLAEAAALDVSADASAEEPDADGDPHPVSEWRSDCDGDCTRRMVSRPSWRSPLPQRALGSERGYHDVGFRLALEPP